MVVVLANWSVVGMLRGFDVGYLDVFPFGVPVGDVRRFWKRLENMISVLGC